MPRVELTRHLYQFFPDLEGEQIEVAGATVAEVLAALEERAPGIGFYVCDERGRIRQHVNVFVGTERVQDRTTLTDPVPPGAAVHIIQALSGG
ncbi:MAG: MoaD/ThiS family protein [Planctomycetota bacterium]